MKKISILLVAACAMMMSSCGTGLLNNAQTSTTNTSTAAKSGSSILGDLIGAATNGQTVGNVLTSVLGLDKLTKKSLVGTWTYYQPGCAFTSENLLAQAGGEVAATEVRNKLQPYYQTVGINSATTKIVFNEDGTFQATFAGKSLSGKWTFSEKDYKVTLSTLLLSLNCYAKKNANGIGLLFESTKLLTLLQTISAMSGNKTLQTVGDISKSYNGLRIGFDFK
jgi:hypothetical protein